MRGLVASKDLPNYKHSKSAARCRFHNILNTKMARGSRAYPQLFRDIPSCQHAVYNIVTKTQCCLARIKGTLKLFN